MWTLKFLIFVSLFGLLGYMLLSLGLLNDAVYYVVQTKNYMTMLPDWFRVVIGFILFGVVSGYIFKFLRD